MAISDKINSIKIHIGEAYTAIQGKEGTIPANKNCENLKDAIASISTTGKTQEKTVNITENGVKITTPDAGYDGISSVTTITNVQPDLQEKVVTPTESQQTTTPDAGYAGLSKVTVGAIQTEELEATPAKGQQVIEPSTGKYYKKVTIEAIPDDYVIPSGTIQITQNGVIDVSDKATANVNVPSKEEETKIVDLAMTSGNQTITPTSGKVFSSVTVNKPATMLPENIKQNVNIGGVVGTFEGGAKLNIHYGENAPEDTSKLWIKSEEPSKISFPVVWKPEQIVEGITDTGTTLPQVANAIGTAAVGTKIYLFGGRSGSSNLKTIQEFDTTDNTLRTLPTTLPIGASYIGTAAVGTKIYLFGGVSSSSNLKTIQEFDTTDNTLRTLPTTLPQGTSDIGTAAVGTKIYLFGGVSNTIQEFDTTNNTIRTLPTTLPQGTSDIGTAAVGTKIYLFGGYSNLKTIQEFDTTNNTLRTLPTTLPQGTYSIGTAAVGTKIYLFGGGSSSSKLNTIQEFDTTNNTIRTLPTTLPQVANAIGTAAVGTKIYLFGGYNGNIYLNTINLFTVNVPLSSEDIIVTQEYYSRTFKIMKAPTEVEVACKYVYKGDQNLAKFIDAYLYDGANWVNVNTGDFTFTKLYPPKISVSGKTLTITNDSRNGSKVANYKVYSGSTLLTTITATTLDLTTVITANGTYNISVVATGTGYTESDNSNVVEYNYAAYNITANLTGVTANASNPTTVSTLASSTLIFTANTGYNLPDSVTVTGAEFTWTKSSGTLTLSNPTSAVSVTIAGAAGGYPVTINFTGFNRANVYDGQSVEESLKSFVVEGETTETIQSGYVYIEGNDPSGYVPDGYFAAEPTASGGVSLQSWNSTNGGQALFKVEGAGTINISFECLIEGTQITLADGSTKAIEDVTYDDELLVWNFYAGRFDKAKPTWIKIAEVAPRYNLVKFSNGSEVGFVGAGGEKGYHRIFNKEASAFTHTGCKDTPNGTTTFAQDGTFPTVVSQEVVEKEVKFYNVITDKHYNLFANGILTSCKLSNKYHIENMRYIGEKLISEEQEKAYFERIKNKSK